MSYLDMLRQRRAEQDSLGRLLASVGGGLAESMTQQRIEAQQRAKILQEQGQAAARAGQYDIAAKAIPQFQEALRAGYDIQPLIAPPVGAPIFEPIMGEAPRPTPSFIGPMPLGQVGKREVGRTFEMPQTKAQIRAGLMMEPPKMLEVGGALLDPETRQWLVSPTAQTPQSRMELLQQRLESSRALNEERIRSAEERASAQRALAMTLAGMRIGSQRELANMRQQPMMGQRAANAFENFISQVPGAIASDIVTMPSGKQGFAVQMPLAVNEQEVARRAALQGFSVTRDQSGNFLLEPTNLMAPRMRAPARPTAKPREKEKPTSVTPAQARINQARAIAIIAARNKMSPDMVKKSPVLQQQVNDEWNRLDAESLSTARGENTRGEKSGSKILDLLR